MLGRKLEQIMAKLLPKLLAPLKKFSRFEEEKFDATKLPEKN
jgi:hypothetical protein